MKTRKLLLSVKEGCIIIQDEESKEILAEERNRTIKSYKPWTEKHWFGSSPEIPHLIGTRPNLGNLIIDLLCCKEEETRT